MHLVSISADITDSQNSSNVSLEQVQRSLRDIQHQLARLTETHKPGSQELRDFFTTFSSNIPTTITANNDSLSSDESVSDAESFKSSVREVATDGRCSPSEDSKYKEIGQPKALSLSLAGDDIGYTSLYHFNFQRKTSVCETSCLCACHSQNWTLQTRLGTSALFKRVFGSLFIGYSSYPVPKVPCDTETCFSGSPGSTVNIRYSFPAWAANRVLYSIFSSHSKYRPSFALRIARRISYAPGNIFSRINSRDFSGAIELLQNSEASVHDIEDRHGISILGAVLRKPDLSPGLIRIIEYLLQGQIDPYVQNDEGESAWHFAARLMFPKTPTSVASADLQAQLYRLFPNPDWDIFHFTHIHKVVVGLRPINLGRELRNPDYRSQVNAKDAVGQTPLGLAAMIGDDQAVQALLMAGADPNIHADSATSLHPLRKAVRAQSVRCVELLLMASAKPFNLDIRGASILHTAAAHSDDVAMIRPLLLAGVPMDGRNTHNCTPLSFTPLKDGFNVARCLLSLGANINNVDKDGDTPLTECIRLNAHNCLKLFLDEGADYETVNKKGWTILHFAATYADMATLEILASKQLCGLDTEVLDIRGKSPMTCLLERQFVPRDRLEMFRSLLNSISPSTADAKEERETDRTESPSDRSEDRSAGRFPFLVMVELSAFLLFTGFLWYFMFIW